MIPRDALMDVRDRESLFHLLRDELDWPVDPEDTFTYNEPLPEGEGQPNVDVSRLVPFSGDDPFAIVLAEFKQDFRRGALRKVLQAIRKKMRERGAYQGMTLEDLVFVCALPGWEGVRFARFTEQEGRQPRLAVFGWDRESVDQTRTLREINLPALRLDRDLFDQPDWGAETVERWRSAWDVERVTREFFREYAAVFNNLEQQVRGVEDDARRMYTQQLMNRLLFCWFLQKKGWLNKQADYLARLFDIACRDKAPGQRRRNDNFLREYLHPLFYEFLNKAPEERPENERFVELQDRLGDVKFLNGGLFEPQPQFDDVVEVPNCAFSPVFELFGRYQFTITESTPDDIEVAVDPEMLGKVFEELVTGRHEQGAYYTPKPIVSFMCREALKSYLETHLDKSSREAIEAFVERHDPQELREADETLLAVLRQIRACDPACGSGAYLLGMLRELLDLRAALFAARPVDHRSIYQRKLDIISRNLYGVDIDPFAVNIARLRLWLSLAIEYEGKGDPPPLPNLDFKIEVGDSLTGPAPSQGGLFHHAEVMHFAKLKEEFLVAHGPEKRELRQQIEEVRAEIRRDRERTHDAEGFDWQVEFAEVFLPQESATTIGGTLNFGQELAERPRPGAFDVVVANPPYVRYQEIAPPYKTRLRQRFPAVYSGAADLYVYFFARAHELMNGQGAAAFISSNKWLRAEYGVALKRTFGRERPVRLVVDFGELPVFHAGAFPGIFIWSGSATKEPDLRWAVVKDLEACYAEGISAHVARNIGPPPRSGRDLLPKASTAHRSDDSHSRMESSGLPLGDRRDAQVYYGILTGRNPVFFVDQQTREEIVQRDPRSAEILRPLVVGDDIRRSEIHFRDRYLVWTYIGISIEEYPGVKQYMERHREALESRGARGPEWWELRGCDYYGVLSSPKIVYPDIAKSSRFALDEDGAYLADCTVFTIASSDLYLLAVLNSSSAWSYLRSLCAVLGDVDAGGRLRLKRTYMRRLPIPDASPAETAEVASLCRRALDLHQGRRSEVAGLLARVGLSIARSNSRNPLEQPWLLTPSDFLAQANRRNLTPDVELFKQVRDETAALTEQIEKVEADIDARVAALYGL